MTTRDTAKSLNADRIPTTSLPGFSHIGRYWDESRDMIAAKLLPGEYYVTRVEETIVTVLGSCVSACIRDTVFGIGGMNHIMLPMSQSDGSWEQLGATTSARYGNFAMEQLVNEILKHGGKRQNLEAKIFGGGRILAHMTDIGRKNIEFVERYLLTDAIKVVARDLGEVYPRKVYYTPATGRASVKKLQSLHNSTIAEREANYLTQLKKKPVAGDVTLF